MDELGSCAVRSWFDHDMAEPEVLTAAGGTACVLSARCPLADSANEDAAAVISCQAGSAVLIVADGMGGSAAGEHAARSAVEALCAAIQEGDGEDALLRSRIITGFERANRAVCELGSGAATTLAVVEISAGVIRPYHAGDSMIMLLGGRGKVKWQAVLHSPVGYGVEAGLIDEDEALHHEQRHLVSNVVGTADMHIAIGPPRRLAPHDTVLLGSDGLFDNLYPAQIVEACRDRQLPRTAQRLAHTALAQMRQPSAGQPSKPDDLTFIVFRLS